MPVWTACYKTFKHYHFLSLAKCVLYYIPEGAQKCATNLLRREKSGLVHAVSPRIEAGVSVAEAAGGMGLNAPTEVVVGEQGAPAALQAAARSTGSQFGKSH